MFIDIIRMATFWKVTDCQIIWVVRAQSGNNQTISVKSLISQVNLVAVLLEEGF